MGEDYYRTLNVSPQASAEEIQRAYRALARRYHPDRNQLPSAASLMAVINEAYEVLGEPVKRAAYDRRKSVAKNSGMDDAFLLGARDLLLKQGWKAAETNSASVTLKDGSRQVRVHWISYLDSVALRRLTQRSLCFSVILTLRIDPETAPADDSTVVIDLTRSRVFAGQFPDPAYENLFRPFLARK